MRSLLCGALLAAWATTAGAAELDGPVVRILDGDTIEVLHNQRPERIRLSGIDCPEKGQAYGNNAKHAVADLAFGKEVTVQTHGKDKYTRTLGDVILPDGMNLNQELVKQGWCWWYRKYAPGDTVLEGLESETREASRGLWADPQPVPAPWESRHRRHEAL
jgi:micrococcal nuclease